MTETQEVGTGQSVAQSISKKYPKKLMVCAQSTRLHQNKYHPFIDQ